MSGGAGLGTSATPRSWARSSASAVAERAGPGRAQGGVQRVALGDLTNVVAAAADGRLGAADAGNEVDEARKLKSSCAELEEIKGKLLEEQRLRERAEMKLSKLQGVEARAQKLELELASCKALLSNKPVGSSTVNMPPQLSDLEKQALETLNKVVEATLTKEIAEIATGEDVFSCLPGMDIAGRGLENTIDQLDELISHQNTKLIVINERLRMDGRKIKSLEQECDQLRSQVALLESKLSHGYYSASSTKVVSMVNTLAVETEAESELNKTEEWMKAVKDLKGQAGSVKKQPVIEISDEEGASIWYDDDKEAPLESNPSGSSETGHKSCHQIGSFEWFFRGNKLMLASGMKKYLQELCDSVPPAIPFFMYQMSKSNLKPRGKMRLSAKYISKPLVSCLRNGDGYVHFEVNGEDHGTVRVKLSPDGRASLTSGWESVIAAKNLKVGDICAFQFKIVDGVLKLSVHVFRVVRYLVIVR